MAGRHDWLLIDRFDVVELPGFVEIGFSRRVETEIGKPSLAGIRFDPVRRARWLLWSEEHID